MPELEVPAAIFAAVGLATLAAAVLPRALRGRPLSMPTVIVAAGALAFTLLPALPDPDPMAHPDAAVHLTEVCVIISLMGAGLAAKTACVQRPSSLKRADLPTSCRP